MKNLLSDGNIRMADLEQGKTRMKKFFNQKYLLSGLLAVLFLTADLASQTVIVHTVPQEDPESDAALYGGDVDSGIMDSLFSMGYIIFSQVSHDTTADLVNMGRETGADYVITWAMEEQGIKGILLDCRSGSRIPVKTVSLAELDVPGENLHRMYMDLGEKLCEQLVPGIGN